MVQRIESRIATWSQIQSSHGEPIQVLRYQAGQEYQAHYDYFFHKSVHGKQPSCYSSYVFIGCSGANVIISFHLHFIRHPSIEILSPADRREGKQYSQ